MYEVDNEKDPMFNLTLSIIFALIVEGLVRFCLKSNTAQIMLPCAGHTNLLLCNYCGV